MKNGQTAIETAASGLLAECVEEIRLLRQQLADLRQEQQRLRRLVGVLAAVQPGMAQKPQTGQDEEDMREALLALITALNGYDDLTSDPAEDPLLTDEEWRTLDRRIRLLMA